MFKNLIGMGLILSCLGVVSLSHAQKVPLENFVRVDEFSQPRLSPDGKYLAITRRLLINDRDVPVINVFSLPDMKEQAVVRMPSFEMPLSYLWVSNTRILVTVGKQIGALEAPMATGEILAMDFNGENQEYLYGYQMKSRSKYGDRFEDNNGHGVVHSVPKNLDGSFYLKTIMWERDMTMLYKVNAKNAQRNFLTSVKQPDVEFLFQQNGKLRFAFGSDKNGNVVLQKYDEKNDSWSVLSKDYTGNNLSPFIFSPDDQYMYALHSKSGEPFSLLKEDVNSGQRTVLLKQEDANVSDLHWGLPNLPPFAASISQGIPKPFYLEKDRIESQLHQKLSGIFNGMSVHFINYTDDGSKLLFKVSSDREPGAYLLYDNVTKKANSLFSSREAIDPETMAKKIPIEFQARDGLKIFGYVTLPNQDNPRGKHPLIVLPHGGPHGVTDEWYFDNDVQFLASRGYAVLQVNFRGSGGRGSNFINKGYKKWGTEIQYDILDGLDWTIKNMPVDEQRICTYGSSFGGYSAMMLAALDNKRIKCAIGYVGVYNLNLLFSDEAESNSRFMASVKRYVGTDKEELIKNSPTTYADKLTMPIFLVHGKEDKRATFSNALAMREALIKVNRPPEWMAVENEGHGFYKIENVKLFYEKLEAFLEKHIGK